MVCHMVATVIVDSFGLVGAVELVKFGYVLQLSAFGSSF